MKINRLITIGSLCAVALGAAAFAFSPKTGVANASSSPWTITTTNSSRIGIMAA